MKVRLWLGKQYIEEGSTFNAYQCPVALRVNAVLDKSYCARVTAQGVGIIKRFPYPYSVAESENSTRMTEWIDRFDADPMAAKPTWIYVDIPEGVLKEGRK